MFSRNEKYGNALHLPYGFEANQPRKATAETKSHFFTKLMSVFLPASEAQSIVDLNQQLEMDLDRSFVDRAITSELRNHESAANQNEGLVTDEKIA